MDICLHVIRVGGVCIRSPLILIPLSVNRCKSKIVYLLRAGKEHYPKKIKLYTAPVKYKGLLFKRMIFSVLKKRFQTVSDWRHKRRSGALVGDGGSTGERYLESALRSSALLQIV